MNATESDLLNLLSSVVRHHLISRLPETFITYCTLTVLLLSIFALWHFNRQRKRRLRYGVVDEDILTHTLDTVINHLWTLIPHSLVLQPFVNTLETQINKQIGPNGNVYVTVDANLPDSIGNVFWHVAGLHATGMELSLYLRQMRLTTTRTRTTVLNETSVMNDDVNVPSEPVNVLLLSSLTIQYSIQFSDKEIAFRSLGSPTFEVTTEQREDSEERMEEEHFNDLHCVISRALQQLSFNIPTVDLLPSSHQTNSVAIQTEEESFNSFLKAASDFTITNKKDKFFTCGIFRPVGRSSTLSAIPECNGNSPDDSSNADDEEDDEEEEDGDDLSAETLSSDLSLVDEVMPAPSIHMPLRSEQNMLVSRPNERPISIPEVSSIVVDCDTPRGSLQGHEEGGGGGQGLSNWPLVRHQPEDDKSITQKGKELLWMNILKVYNVPVQENKDYQLECFVEVNEPFQRFSTLPIDVVGGLYWDQNFLIELNQNSNTLTFEVFCLKRKTKKCIFHGVHVTHRNDLRPGLFEDVFRKVFPLQNARPYFDIKSKLQTEEMFLPELTVEFRYLTQYSSGSNNPLIPIAHTGRPLSLYSMGPSTISSPEFAKPANRPEPKVVAQTQHKSKLRAASAKLFSRSQEEIGLKKDNRIFRSISFNPGSRKKLKEVQPRVDKTTLLRLKCADNPNAFDKISEEGLKKLM